MKKGRYRGRCSVTVNLKSTERVALYLVRIRRTAQVDSQAVRAAQRRRRLRLGMEPICFHISPDPRENVEKTIVSSNRILLYFHIRGKS